jgi:hypothetical protein
MFVLMFVLLGSDQDRTWGIGKGALGVLELNGGVIDVKAAK